MSLLLLVLNISSFELVKFHMHKNSTLWWHKTNYMYFSSLFYPARRSTAIPDQCHKLQTPLPLLCLVPYVAGNSSLFHIHVVLCASFPRTREGSLNMTLVHCGILHSQILLLSFFTGWLCCYPFVWLVIWLQNPAHFWNYCSRIHKCQDSRPAEARSFF